MPMIYPFNSNKGQLLMLLLHTYNIYIDMCPPDFQKKNSYGKLHTHIYVYIFIYLFIYELPIQNDDVHFFPYINGLV